MKSAQQLLQVYAPNKMKENEAIKKITTDQEGAKEHWGSLFNKWTFVHNADDGLPPHVQKVLLGFQQANQGINIETWGLEGRIMGTSMISLGILWFAETINEKSLNIP